MDFRKYMVVDPFLNVEVPTLACLGGLPWPENTFLYGSVVVSYDTSHPCMSYRAIHHSRARRIMRYITLKTPNTKTTQKDHPLIRRKYMV